MFVLIVVVASNSPILDQLNPKQRRPGKGERPGRAGREEYREHPLSIFVSVENIEDYSFPVYSFLIPSRNDIMSLFKKSKITTGRDRR